MLIKKTVEEFINQSASDAPTPGGGGIAALAGSLGAAMASMAANFTVGRKKFVDVEEEVQSILGRLAPLIASLRDAVDGDAVAFAFISEAYKLPKETDEEKNARREAINAALTASMQVPAKVVDDCLAAAELLPRLAEIANPNLLSDVEVAAVMLDAACRAARINVLVNSSQLGAAAGAVEMDTFKKTEQTRQLMDETLAEVAKRR